MHIRAIVRFLHFEKLPTHKAQYKNTVLLCFDITAVTETITPYDPQKRQKACKRPHDRWYPFYTLKTCSLWNCCQWDWECSVSLGNLQSDWRVENTAIFLKSKRTPQVPYTRIVFIDRKKSLPFTHSWQAFVNNIRLLYDSSTKGILIHPRFCVCLLLHLQTAFWFLCQTKHQHAVVLNARKPLETDSWVLEQSRLKTKK